MARLLWITDRYPPGKGGMAVSCARQTAALRRHGLALDVLHFGHGVSAEPLVEERDNGTDIHLPAETEPGFAANQCWVTVQQRHAQRPYTQVVGFGAAFAGFHAVTYAAWLDLPSAVLVRGNDMDRDWFLPLRGSWLREAFGRAKVIGAVTMEKVRRIQRLFPEKAVMYTPNSVDGTQWELLPADRARRAEVRGLLGGPVIGLFGELKAKKRVPLWLEAVRDAGLLNRVRLLVVGTLDTPTSILLEDPAIAPRSLRIPFCPPGELPGLYAACDFVAIPSMFEGMPNVLLEAMACGVIPIVSDAGAMGEVVTDGETGFLFAAENRVAAGQSTARALGLSEAEREAMSARVREHVAREYSPERETERLLALLALVR